MKAMLGAALVAAALAGCTSVRVVQREGCWVKQTERLGGQIREELGPCQRPEPQWAADRYTRVVQECVAQADYRWRSAAMAAWNRGEPIPPQPADDALLQACMSESTRAIVVENEALKARVAELSGDKDELRASVKESNEQLRATVEESGDQLRASNDKLTEYLGQAAQKPAGTATATASSSSEGTLKTATDSSLKAVPATLEADVPISRAAHHPRREQKASPELAEQRARVAAEVSKGPACTPEGAKKTIAQAGPEAGAETASAPKPPAISPATTPNE